MKLERTKTISLFPMGKDLLKKGALFGAMIFLPLMSMAQNWPSANQEAKAGTRWWWLGSAVDTANIRWNMEQYASHGIGALEITPIYGVQGNDKNNIPYLSDKWMEMLRFVESQGKRLGIEIDMATGTGWPFGGPWVKMEESASKMVIVDKSFEGKRIKDFDISNDIKDRKNSKIVAVFCYGPANEFIDLTSQVASDKAGGVTINDAKLPEKGTWRVIALYQKMGIMKVKRAAPGGEGLVVDHFNKSSVEHYLSHISDAFDKTGTPYPHTFFNDSYEISDADYTPELFLAFNRLRGYSLKENFAKLVDGDRKVVADYRETLGDLLLENFTKTWTSWAHSHGAVTRNQAHGSPANLIDCYSAVDIPEIEGFGLSEFGIKGLRTDPGKTRKNDSDFSMLKWASSASHIMGKKYTSSETFTWLTEHFRTSLSQMKPDLDLMFCAGVNHMFFHGTCYSPKDDKWPGWKFYASVDMSPTNTIWRDAPFLMKYIQRSQSFLQWGKPDNDFLVFLPVRDIWNTRSKGKRLMQFAIHNMKELAPDFVKAVLSIDSNGYDCDYISEQKLLNTHCDNGAIVTESGARYKGLIIPNANNILTDDVKKQIEILEAMGANIIVGADKVKSDVKNVPKEEMKTRFGLKMIRRSNPDGYHYFIANLTPNDVNDMVKLAVHFNDALWFNPMNGDRYRAEIKNGSIRMDLKSGESMILETFNDKIPEDTSITYRKDSPYENSGKLLSKGWELSFTGSTPDVKGVYEIDNLSSWENINDTISTLMGTGVYETTINLTSKNLEGCNDWAIDLGDVRESARVYINDKLIGCAWSVPYILQFSNVLKVGENDIRIEVTNLPANRISKLDRDGVKWRKMNEINVVDINYKKTTYADWKPVPSGLNSRVFLYRVK